MAVIAVPYISRLQLRLNVGEDENFNPLYRTRSFSNVKTGAENEDLYELAGEIADLQIHPLSMVRRVDEFELEDDE